MHSYKQLNKQLFLNKLSFQGKIPRQFDSQKQILKYLEIWHSKGSRIRCQQRPKIQTFSSNFLFLKRKVSRDFWAIETKNHRKNYPFTENFLTRKSYGNAQILCCEYVGQHLSSAFAEQFAIKQHVSDETLLKKCWLSFISLFINAWSYNTKLHDKGLTILAKFSNI